MLTNKKFTSALLLFSVAGLFISGCEKFVNESPTAADDSIEALEMTEPASLSKSNKPNIFVNTTSDVEDFSGSQQVGDLPGPDGVVSLREAITVANNTAGPQVIGFKIPKSDAGFDGKVFTIKPLGTGLPNLLNHGTTIDGSSQALYSGDTNPLGPEIVLDGSLASGGGISLFVSNDNTILGLVIHGFSGAAIQFIENPDNLAAGPNNNKIARCYLGTDETGSTAIGNGLQGVALIGNNNIIEGNLISGNALGGIGGAVGGSGTRVQGNFIGTDRTGKFALGNQFSGVSVEGNYGIIEGNLISGNNVAGIGVGLSVGARIQGNLIGTDRTGRQALGNIGFGIFVGDQASNSLIGGVTSKTRNVISGNTDNGVAITGSGNHLIGNFIGTDIKGINPVPNGGLGVQIVFNAAGNLVERNLIAHNASDGISVGFNAIGNTLSMNSLFSNGALGIDLGNGGVDDYHGDGLTPNDPGDADTGPNNLMNFPVLASAKIKHGKLIVEGIIDTPNPQTATIEFFANPAPNPGGDPSGHGEGAVFLGADKPDALGKFSAKLRRVKHGTLITATATDADGNTSEFAANVAAQ